MAFIPAHDAIVMFMPESGEITESPDGVVPAHFSDNSGTAQVNPAIESTAKFLLGYTDFPEFARGLNNSKGFAIGARGAAYNKRGRREPSITVNIRPGNVAALKYLFPNPATGRFTSLALFVITNKQSCDYFRFCKPSSVAFNFSGGEGQGGELTIAVTFQAIAHHRVDGESIVIPGPGVLRSLGEPLMWHDVRGLSLKAASYTNPVTGGAANTMDLRRAVSSLSATLDMGLERKNERPYWGDHVPLSSTCYEMLEHHSTVTGEMTLHERLPKAFFDAVSTAQNWQELTVKCSNLTGSKFFDLKLTGCFPTDEKSAGGESSKELDYTVSFAADDIEFTGPAEEEDED